MSFTLGLAPAGLLTPVAKSRVKSHLLLALVPLGLAISSAGMAALEEMYTARRQDLADLKVAIAEAEAARLALRDGPAPVAGDVWDPGTVVVEMFEGKADELVPAAASTT